MFFDFKTLHLNSIKLKVDVKDYLSSVCVFLLQNCSMYCYRARRQSSDEFGERLI